MNYSIFGSSAPKIVFDHNAPAKEFSVNTGTNVLTYVGTQGNLYNGQRIKLATTGTLPSPLAINTNYYVINDTGGTCKLSLTRGGTEIDITTAGSGTHTILTELIVMLDYWVPMKEDADSRNVQQESELEADRIILSRGEYLEIQGRINLFKYADMASRQSKFQEIYELKNKNVSFWKHRDGEPYKDEDGNEVLFYLESVIPRNLNTLDYRDVIFLKFLSLKGIDYPNSFAIIPVLEEIVMDSGIVVNI